MAAFTFKYFYSTKRDVELCKEGYDLLESARKKQKGQNIWSIDLGTDAQSATRYATSTLPVFVTEKGEVHGDNAIAELCNVLKVARQKAPAEVPLIPVDSTLPPVDNLPPVDTLPPIGPPSASASVSESPVVSGRTSTASTPQQPAYSTAPVEPMYVLYTDDTMSDINVPADGYVLVQSYSLIRTTIARDKLPNYLKAEQKPLPILVSRREDRPTVFYGTAAKDWCTMLCLLHGGAMLR